MHCIGEGMPRDVEGGAKYYAAAAEDAHPVAMFNWGVMLRQGIGVKTDESVGASWIERAAKAGLKEAQSAVESGK